MSVSRSMASLVMIELKFNGGEKSYIWLKYGNWYYFDKRKIRCTTESSGKKIDSWMALIKGKKIEDAQFNVKTITLSVKIEGNISICVHPCTSREFEHWDVFISNGWWTFGPGLALTWVKGEA